MNIQWYPGHMHKASKELIKLLPQVELVIEVLDARLPFSSENPMLGSIRGDKPCIKVLNKTDLADPVKTRQWQDFFEQEKNVKTLAVSSLTPDKTRQISDLCRKMMPEKSQNNQLIKALIMGIPNVGKSTIINVLAGKTIAKTGNEPAVTKNQQRINIGNNTVLFDTPGMLWPNLENRNSGYRLATTGAIKDTAISHDDIAYFAADFLRTMYPNLLMQRYQLEQLPSTETEVLESIGRKRGCLRSGGKVDLDKAAKALLADLRSGSLGQITLETPEMMQKELAELEIIRAEKAAKKEARLKRRKNSKSR